MFVKIPGGNRSLKQAKVFAARAAARNGKCSGSQRTEFRIQKNQPSKSKKDIAPWPLAYRLFSSRLQTILNSDS